MKRQLARAFLLSAFWAAVLLAHVPAQSASDPFARGEALLSENRPTEAIPLLEAALKADPALEKAYLYLGLAYQQTGRLDEAISVLKRGIPRSEAWLHLIYYNLGNCYFRQGKNAFADEMYTQALAVRPGYGSALLNRANSKMGQREYEAAVLDYRQYLAVAPDSAQRPSIERVIALIESDRAEAERQRVELARRQAEEEARKASILDAVAESLREAASSTTTVAAGSEGAQSYEEESELAD